MKTSIRRGVFETNSSTNHTYTFSVEDVATNKRGVKLDTFEKKAALIDWLFEEVYPNDRWLLEDGLLWSPYCCTELDRFDDEFKQKLFELASIPEGADKADVVDMLVDKITENEDDFFADKGFSYMGKLEMKEWDDIVCTLSKKQLETLALKFGLVMLLCLSDEAEILKYRQVFFNLIEGKIDGDTFIEIQVDSVCPRLLTVARLREIFLSEVKRLSGKTVETIWKKVGYIGFDGLLNDYYDFDVFVDQLGLDVTDYDKFADSLDKFLTDENKVVIAD